MKNLQFPIFNFRRNTGQSTLEIIIAFTVLTIGITSAVLVVFSSQSVSLDSFESNQALRLAEQQLENARAFANVATTGGNTGGGGTSGNWANPRTLGSINLGSGEQVTDLDVKNKFVYVTAVASDIKKPDMFAVAEPRASEPKLLIEAMACG